MNAERPAASDERFTRRASMMKSPHPEIRSEPAERLGREGMVTVWDEHGRIVGCIGVELWRALLNAQAVAP